MANEKRLIDANAFQFEPDPVDNIMNGVLFLGRDTGKTLRGVKCCLKAMIKNAPTVDAVEVVRCRECVHYKPQDQGVHRNCTTPYCMRVVAIKVNPDDFCSYGERREGE